MRTNLRKVLVIAIAGFVLANGSGCAIGPRSVEQNRLRYNEAVKTTTEQQLLLNIVRLRYIDTPSSLAISNIAEQHEIVAGLHAIPFFQASAAGLATGGYRGLVLPQAEVTGANRPTLSYTPLDDQEFTRRLFTPISLEGTAYLGKTTWPISTVFRMYLENLNWVSNAENGSGPTPRDPPEYADFLNGIHALQRLQERKLVVLFNEEREEKLSDPVPTGNGTAAAAIESAKSGFEYRKDDKGGWSVVRKKSQPLLRIGRVANDDPDWVTFSAAFHLNPVKRSFDLTTEKLDPFPTDEKKLDVLDLETRSLLQVLFFLAHGVDVPPAHVASTIAPSTVGVDGGVFDWQQVLGGLFKVCWAEGKNPPPHAHVAICYKGYWFYIDERDRDSKTTFALLVEISRLELGAKTGANPILTLPLGGR